MTILDFNPQSHGSDRPDPTNFAVWALYEELPHLSTIHSNSPSHLTRLSLTNATVEQSEYSTKPEATRPGDLPTAANFVMHERPDDIEPDAQPNDQPNFQRNAQLTAEFLNNVDSDVFRLLPGAVFSRVSLQEFARLLPATIASLSGEQLGALTTAQLRALSREQIQMVSIYSMTSMRVSDLANAQLTQLTAEQRNALSREQLNQIGMRLPHLFGNLPPAAGIVAHLTPTQIRALPASSLDRFFNDASIPHLLPGQWAAFSPEQLQALFNTPARRGQASQPRQDRINSLSQSALYAVQRSYGTRTSDDLSRALQARATHLYGSDSDY